MLVIKIPIVVFSAFAAAYFLFAGGQAESSAQFESSPATGRRPSTTPSKF